MIPKVEAAWRRWTAACSKIHIIDGRLRHSLLLEVYTTKGVGTEIVGALNRLPPNLLPSPAVRNSVRSIDGQAFECPQKPSSCFSNTSFPTTAASR